MQPSTKLAGGKKFRLARSGPKMAGRVQQQPVEMPRPVRSVGPVLDVRRSTLVADDVVLELVRVGELTDV